MPALADEMARLSRENAELRSQILSRTPEVIIEGLSVEEMRRILTNRGVLSFLLELRDSEAKRRNSALQPETRQLEQLGLVESVGAAVVLTHSGRRFLNRFEAEQLNRTATKRESSD